jgi:hypothetical protein
LQRTLTAAQKKSYNMHLSSSSPNFMLIALAACVLLGCTTHGVAAASLRGSQSRNLDASSALKKDKPPVISTDFTTVQAFR